MLLDASQPRVEHVGAFYHVIIRGNQRQRTFHDDQDRRAYLGLRKGDANLFLDSERLVLRSAGKLS